MRRKGESKGTYIYISKEPNKIKVINILKFNLFFTILPIKPIDTTMHKLILTLQMSLLDFNHHQNALTLIRKKGVLQYFFSVLLHFCFF